jgi:two-component system, cell cycle sensor histidine kinase and response regulator CckA
MNIADSQNEEKNGLHILVVDDDPGMLEVTALLLDHQGYVVTRAAGSSEALMILKEEHTLFDIVLTDYNMPVVNGIDLAMSIRELSDDLPVILYTGKNDLINETLLERAKISVVASKPCTVNMLDEIIKDVINEKKQKYAM